MSALVFLDIDGVLNSRAGFRASGEDLEDTRVARLNRILDVSGAAVVLSSSWRIVPGFDVTVERLRDKGLRARVIGATPRIGDRPRGAEIARWLVTERKASRLALALGWTRARYVVLDDDRGAGEGHRTRFVHVVDGLEDEHVQRALGVLGCAGEPHVRI